MLEKGYELKSFFRELDFNEKLHKYYVKGSPIEFSVSGKIKKFYRPFEKDSVASYCAQAWNTSKSEVIKDWDKARDDSIDLGNDTHIFGEYYPFDRSLKPKTGHQEAVVNFWKDLPNFIVPVIMELRMYHKEYLFAGTTDIVLYNTQKDCYILGDYKTNKDIFKNYKGQKLLGPFSHLLDCPLNKYQIQLNYYKILFEQTGNKVDKMVIVWLTKDGKYHMKFAEDFSEILLKDLETEKLAYHGF